LNFFQIWTFFKFELFSNLNFFQILTFFKFERFFFPIWTFFKFELFSNLNFFQICTFFQFELFSNLNFFQIWTFFSNLNFFRWFLILEIIGYNIIKKAKKFKPLTSVLNFQSVLVSLLTPGSSLSIGKAQKC